MLHGKEADLMAFALQQGGFVKKYLFGSPPLNKNIY
jgi:hypothetical protein